MNEDKIKEKVHNMRQFYVNCTIFGVVVVASVLIWALTGGGYFWPAWVIFGGGIGLALQAISIGAFPVLNEYFPFFKQDWEDKQIRDLKKTSHHHRPAIALHTATKPATTKKKAAPKKKKVASKKVAPKKVAAKKKAPLKKKVEALEKIAVNKVKKAKTSAVKKVKKAKTATVKKLTS